MAAVMTPNKPASYYTTARLVSQSFTDDIVTKSGPKNGLISQSASTSSDDSRFKNTRMCVFHQKGACTKGANCTYAHTTDQLKNAPNLFKTRLCQDWFNGCCVTPNCRFAHGRHELRFTFDYYKTKMCHFWQNGGCTKGNMCRHAHGEEELRPMPPEGGDGVSISSTPSTSTSDEENKQPARNQPPTCVPKPSQEKKGSRGNKNRPPPVTAEPAPATSKPSRRNKLAGNSGGGQKSSRGRSTAKKAVASISPETSPQPTVSAQTPSSRPTQLAALDSTCANDIAEAVRLAEVAQALADRSNAILKKVAEDFPVSCLLPVTSPSYNVNSARHSVACPREFLPAGLDPSEERPTDFQFYDEIIGAINDPTSRFWGQRHSAPECDLQSLAEEILPFLTSSSPEELRLTSSRPATSFSPAQI